MHQIKALIPNCDYSLGTIMMRALRDTHDGVFHLEYCEFNAHFSQVISR